MKKCILSAIVHEKESEDVYVKRTVPVAYRERDGEKDKARGNFKGDIAGDEEDEGEKVSKMNLYTIN